MKKLLTILSIFFSISASAQNLDTVSVSMTQKADVWAMFVGKHASNTDSATIRAIRIIETQVRANPPANYSADVTITGLPGRIIVAMYNDFVNMKWGVIASRGTAIRNSFRAISVLIPFFDEIEAAQPAHFNRLRDIGKHKLLDD